MTGRPLHLGDIVIVDGAIDWGGGPPRAAALGFDIEARHTAIYEWVRQVRGGVLAGAFTVERHLSAAILYFILGERIAKPEVQTAFDEGLLAPLTFERRISVALLIAPHLLPTDQVASFKGELTDLRTLRNAMAHRPFWHHPELNDAGEVVNLVPVIMRGKAPLPLTTLFVEQTNVKIASVIAQAYALAEAARSASTPRARDAGR